VTVNPKSPTDLKYEYIPFVLEPPVVLAAHLNEVRDEGGKPLGFDMGRGKELCICFQGDHGGDLFTCLQVNCTHEGCNQNTVRPMGPSRRKRLTTC
jgi:hypothetical protein